MNVSDQKSKTILYIDGANMFYAQQKMGWFIDWQKVVNYFKKEFQVNAVKFYTGVKDIEYE